MPHLETWLTKTVGVNAPFIQGGLQWVAKAELVSAVANAGALGFLAAFTFPNPEALREEIRKCRKMCEGKTFGVNFTLLPALNPPDYVAFAQVAVDEGIRIFETAGNPKPIMGTLRKAENPIIIHKCVTVAHAIKAEKAGVSAISIDGFECAGHPGEDDITTLILLARVRQELTIPIIASGGFADGNGAAAALAAGAAGVNMGTRWLATKEAPVHNNVKEAMVKAKETDTALLLRSLNNSVRCYHNKVAAEVLRLQEDAGKDFKFTPEVGALMSGQRGKVVYETGDQEYGIWSVGQSVGLIHDIPNCKDLVRRLVKETVENIERAYSLIKSDSNM